jgi:hypothetical protein
VPGYKKLLTILIPAWFLIALSASALDVFRNDSQRVGGAVAIAAVTPILLFAIAFAASASFRRFTLSLNPQVLTLVQSWRFLGFVFVLLQAHDLLPAIFALPAGYGDMAIGLTATYVALKLASSEHRSSFIAWQMLGMADLVMAVGLGTTARILSPAGASMQLMTVLPLSLVPTFIVPLLLIFHVICIAQARQWGRAPRGLGSSRLAGAIG